MSIRNRGEVWCDCENGPKLKRRACAMWIWGKRSEIKTPDMYGDRWGYIMVDGKGYDLCPEHRNEVYAALGLEAANETLPG